MQRRAFHWERKWNAATYIPRTQATLHDLLRLPIGAKIYYCKHRSNVVDCFEYIWFGIKTIKYHTYIASITAAEGMNPFDAVLQYPNGFEWIEIIDPSSAFE